MFAPSVLRGGVRWVSSKAKPVVTSRAVDFPQWYLDVVAEGDLVDSHVIVKGCATLKPRGYALWERIRDVLDARIKATGHQNVYFPALVPTSLLNQEAAHVAGFAKECAVVTHHRLVDDGSGKLVPDATAELGEPLVLRPTSEAVVWDSFRRWVQSHRDLPVLLNQWANVFRWEMRTRPFLRTSEFLWQEGHTAHATREEAETEATTMLGEYVALCEGLLCVPVVRGVKSNLETFAGADRTHTIEAMMPNGWALQAGTSHFLGQNFAKAFGVTFLTDGDAPDGHREHVWATSWGVSTRLIGALIMSHSDDAGLVLPAAVAPVQVVVVAIGDMEVVGPHVEALRGSLAAAGIRVHVDTRTHLRPGGRYFEWERKGVPLRIDVGPRDVDAGSVKASLRPQWASPHQLSLVDRDVSATVSALLGGMDDGLREAAAARLEARTVSVSTYAEMRDAITGAHHSLDGPAFFLAPWAADDANEAAIQEDCKATLRCFPDAHNPPGVTIDQPCFYSGHPATHMALFARAF